MSRSSSSSLSKNSKAFGMSSYSINKSGPMNRMAKTNLKEELISKKITEIFRDKDQRMIRAIEQTIIDDKLKIYKSKRAEYEEELAELDKEKVRVIKRKKNKKERMKALRANSRQMLCYLVRALNDTVIHYKTIYFENDFYRLQRLLTMLKIEKDPAHKKRTGFEFLNNLYHSPFKEDRRFMIKHLAIETRDRLPESKHLVDALFFDKIFKLMLTSPDEANTMQAYDIMCNLIMDDSYRTKIRDDKNNYIRQMYESYNLEKIDERRLEKVSHITTLIAYHSDMLERIVECKLLQFIIQLADPKYSVAIRSNAVLAISMLTYHETLFHELINNNVIDMIMSQCMDPNLDISIKRFSTLALVHFALSRDSIQILLDKGIMDLFNALSSIDSAQIHTNVSWVFLALCNNGITGKQMLLNGITRDMFLVSCNPQFSQIRHLVIAGFAELGRADNLQEQSVQKLTCTLQRIKEKAIVGTQEAFKREDAPHTIDVLLRFSLSNQSAFKLTAFWALKDYILLNHGQLVDDLKGIICAFVNGAAEKSDKVKAESANAISFLITHHLVFTEAEAKRRLELISDGSDTAETGFNEEFNYILDALMYLTGQDSLEVRTRAFSTLSSLSTYASQDDNVMTQIQQDIKLPAGKASNDYYSFIEDRLAKSQAVFRQNFETKNIEKDYAGLYCLLRLAQEPDEVGTEEAACLLRQFYFPEINFKPLEPSETKSKTGATPAGVSSIATPNPESQAQFNNPHSPFVEPLTEEEKRLLSVNMFNDELDERELQLDELNEKFFMYVFKALLYTKNRRILYQLIDVINFYIKHETPYQKDVINPSTILWLLQIIDTHKQDSDLCLLAAKTVLKVVNNHQIVFDYQEMAIIKKFNKALDNISHQANQSKQSDGDESSVAMTPRDSIVKTPSVNKTTMDAGKSSMLSAVNNVQTSAVQNDAVQVDPLDPEAVSEQQIQKNADESFDSDKFHEAIERYSKQEKLSSKSNQDNATGPVEGGTTSVDDILKLSHRSIATLKPSRSLRQIEQEADNQMQEILDRQKQQSQMSQSQKSNKIRQSQLMTEMSMSNKKNIFGENSPTLKADRQGLVSVTDESSGRKMTRAQVAEHQLDEKQIELRDAIIKSFMVIFTNEKSQHLLLNKDIIEIAFSCLENVFMISHEAKHNLARLISIIFKFPQVQDRLLKEPIILGIVFLLQTPNIHKSPILKYIVTACSYISLNFNFVNSHLSIHILKALVPIVSTLLAEEDPRTSNINMASQELVNSTQKSQENITSRKNSVDTYLEQRLQSQIVTPIDVRSERDNSIFAVSNLLKGHPNNANYMIQCDGAKMILIEILRIQDTKSSLSKEIIELLLGCVKQLTDQKKMLQDFLSFSTENLNLLPACLEKCFEISDSWHTCTSEILLFKKLFIEGERNYEGEDPNIRMSRLAAQERKMKRLDTEQILNIDYKNIEKIKILEKLEEKEDKSFVMAPMCKLRNHCYNIATSCLAACFSQGFLLEQCKLIERIIMDLSENEKNDFIFQNLIGILRTFKKDKQAIQVLFQKYSTQLIELIRSMEDTPNKRNSLMKTMVYLVLRAPEELCSLDPKIMGNFFALAIEIDDDEVKENILWLQSALVEINCSEEQNQKAIELCTEFKSAQIYLKSLASENEIIVLQAIKGLKSLAAIPSFKAIILIDIGDELFQSLAQILASRLQKFTKCPLEIEVELIGFLAQITESSAASKDPLTIAAKRRAVQQGFMEHFLVRTSDIEYQVVQDIDILNENCAKLNNLDLMQINSGDNKVNSSGPGSARQRAALNSIEIEDLAQGGDFDPCSVLPDFDRVEREDGMNHLVENTMRLAANVTELAETHDQLVHGRGQVLMQTCALLQNMVSQCIEVESEQVDMLQYSIGNREICDSLTKIVLNLCLSTNPTSQPGGQSIQDHCVDNSIGNLMVHVCRSLIDYELHSNLYRAMCLLAVSPNQQNRTHFVESDCLTEVQQAAENNRFFRVRRTCSKAIEQFGSELFELNEKIQRKRRKANKKRNGNGNNVQLQDGNLVNIQHQ